MLRREIIKMLAGGTALAGLSSCNGVSLPTIPISVQLPASVQTFINNVNDIFSKIDSLGSAVGTTVAAIENQAKNLIGQITAGGSASSLGTALLGLLGDIAPLLPPPYGAVATAILTLLPSLAGLISAPLSPSLAARTSRYRAAMTVDDAWRIIYSR